MKHINDEYFGIKEKNYCELFDDCENNAEVESDWHVAGCGETLEKDWVCKKCGQRWREVYIYSCMINNDTEREI